MSNDWRVGEVQVVEMVDERRRREKREAACWRSPRLVYVRP